MEKRRILIATPVDGLPESAMVPYGYSKALARLMSEMRDDLDIQIADQGLMGYPADLVRARSRAVRIAKEYHATHILWLDSDIIPKQGCLGAMLNSGHDMIGCPYPRKRIHWDRVSKAMLNEQTEWLAYDYAYHFSDGDEGRQEVTVTNGCVPVLRCAMGCMLSSMRALEAMVDMYRDELWFVDVIDGKHFDCVGIFQLMLSQLMDFRGRPFRTLYSEDYSFCERYNRMRAERSEFGSIQMLVSHPADHVGGHLYQGSSQGLAAAR
jgi:hypothetical protein